MKIKLNETQVSLTSSTFFLWLHRNRIKLLVFIPLVLIFAVMFLGFNKITSDNTDYIESEPHSGDYAMYWQHYSEFDMSNPHISVKLDSTSDEIYLSGNKAQITYTVKVYPENIREKIEYEWVTSNDVVAMINQSGVVESSVPGEVEIKIIVRYNGVEYSDSAKLRVIQPAEGIYMPTTTINLYNGGSGQMISATVSPESASNKKIIWESDNEKIASVDENGFVTPISTGVTKIRATTEDGGYSGQCFVNVINYAVMVKTVDIQNEYKHDAHLKQGEILKIAAAVAPANARDKTLKWTSTNPEVASVSQTGIIRALNVGETYINVAAVNGVQDMLKLTVEPGDTTDRLNLYKEENTVTGNTVANGTVKYTNYPLTLDEIVDIQMAQSTPPKSNGGKKIATREEVYQHMDPTYYKDGAYKYQFLDLSCPNNISADELNKYLKGKGVLEGHAQDFINAANKYNVSELYLVAHSSLETGNGTSALASGIEVNGTTVYNMFGIGAYDNSAVYSGSQRAYKEGWTSVTAAIDGGAEFISRMYVNASAERQNTLYKMLFNPGNPGEHQYATDCEWAVSQATILDRLFKLFPTAIKSYEIPLYSGMSAFVINTD